MNKNSTSELQLVQAPRVSPETPAVTPQPHAPQPEVLAPIPKVSGEAEPAAAGAVQPLDGQPPSTQLPDQAEPGASSTQPVVEPAITDVQSDPPGAMESMIDGVSSFIDLGGPVVALLLVLSVFALTIIMLKLWQFYYGGGASNKKVSAIVSLWLGQDYEKALSAIRTLNGPVANVVSFAMNGAASRRDEAHLREETEHLAVSEITSLRSYLRGLEAVVQVAPLLGLFGTVLGMIEAFRALAAAGAQVNPADLAGGIWVALLTTAVGLAIAMPVSLVLHWFEGRIDRIRNAMELFITEVMTNPPSRAVKISGAEGARVRLAHAAEGKNAV